MKKIVDIRFPKADLTTREGTIGQWVVRPGAAVSRGEIVATMETDKAITEVEAPASGVITEQLFAIGATVAVGEAIARMSIDDDQDVRSDS
jgi:pyruvate/2-oxoglutarate dehydrogenase complex dihydrolipoamide acyltransferase (E2) component